MIPDAESRPEVLRLFFALWPDASVCRALVRASRPWVRTAGGRAVPREKLHLTLAFLGSVGADRCDELKSLAAALAVAPFEVVLDRLGYFRRARTLWLGSATLAPGLAALEAHLWAALEASGWPREARPFTPHVTLVRKARDVGNAASLKPVVWPVRHFSLVQSRTTQRGATYRELARWPLRGG